MQAPRGSGPWPVAAAVALVAVAVVAAVDGVRHLPAPAPSSAAAIADPSGDRACRPLTGRAPFSARLALGSGERTFHVVPPARGEGPFPLVIGFHGRGGNGAAAARTFALERAIERPFLALYPDGEVQIWMHDAVGWDTRDETSPDLAFFDALVEWARREACADAGPVAVLGYSWGGGMANHVACTRPAAVRAVVSVAGGGPPMPCSGSVSALIAHGTGDLEEPLASGRDSLEAWAFAARCGAREQPAFAGACQARVGCAPGREVLWCEHSGGHTWPDFLRAPALGRFLSLVR